MPEEYVPLEAKGERVARRLGKDREARIEYEIEVKAPEPDKFNLEWQPDIDEAHRLTVSIPGHHELLYTGTHKVVVFESDVPALMAKVEQHPGVLEEARSAFVNSLRDQVNEHLPKAKHGWTDEDLKRDTEIQRAFTNVQRSHGDSVQSHYRSIMRTRHRRDETPRPIVRCEEVRRLEPLAAERARETSAYAIGKASGGGGNAEVAELRRTVEALTETVREQQAQLDEAKRRKGGRPPKKNKDS